MDTDKRQNIRLPSRCAAAIPLSKMENLCDDAHSGWCFIRVHECLFVVYRLPSHFFNFFKIFSKNKLTGQSNCEKLSSLSETVVENSNESH